MWMLRICRVSCGTFTMKWWSEPHGSSGSRSLDRNFWWQNTVPTWLGCFGLDKKGWIIEILPFYHEDHFWYGCESWLWLFRIAWDQIMRFPSWLSWWWAAYPKRICWMWGWKSLGEICQNHKVPTKSKKPANSSMRFSDVLILTEKKGWKKLGPFSQSKGSHIICTKLWWVVVKMLSDQIVLSQLFFVDVFPTKVGDKKMVDNHHLVLKTCCFCCFNYQMCLWQLGTLTAIEPPLTLF